MTKILFVCLGNICRSPLAEGVLRHKLVAAGLQDSIEVDSCGTSNYHIGDLPDPRTRNNAASHGVILTHRARQLEPSDADTFDYILAMDEKNLANSEALFRQHGKKPKHLGLLRAFEEPPTQAAVPDPYYGSAEDFEAVYQIVDRATEGLLRHLSK